ncbi:MAG: DUF2867 domain-containing protein [Gordonia sp. (in: high G+C Gram-positive bacteria)]
MAIERPKHDLRSTVRTGASAKSPPPFRAVGVAALPVEVREYCGLDRIDFADVVSVEGGPSRTAESWARTILGDVPNLPEILIWQVAFRGRLDRRRSRDLVAGWQITHRDDHRISLETPSSVLSLRVIVIAVDKRVELITCVRFDTTRGKVIWKAIEPLHGFAVPRMVAKRLASATREDS